MENITENQYAHWLFNVPGSGNTTIDKLLSGGKSCRDIYEMQEKELREVLTAKQIKYLLESRNTWDFDKEKRKLAEKDIRFISRIDKEFPEKLKYIGDAPFAIYVKGRLPDPNVPSVAVIGARMCSEYGRYMSRQLGRGLALAGVQVISGMARGVDGISQKAALQSGGKSYGILGCGVDICYPEENREVYEGLCSDGGIISEYPPGTMPKANFFPMRNRIISAMADVIVVVEARLHSGTQITVDTALEQGREVLAVPGRITDRLSDGCNSLICQGAGVVLSVEDVLDRVMLNRRSKDVTKEADASEVVAESAMDSESALSIEDLILEVVDVIPVSASHIMEMLYQKNIDISIPQLLSKLMDLIYQGAIVQESGYYRRRMETVK